jgi:ketosteroid isomerase-like protein
MRTLLTLWTLSLAAVASASAPLIDRQAALDAVVSAERAFAKASAEKGTRDAFLEFLADDSVLFRPDPVPGKEFIRNRPASPGLLSWYPIHAEVSLAGDLGYTTGPFEFRAQGADDPRVGRGHYVTVWKKQADGSYKAMIDIGVPTPGGSAGAAPKIPPAEPAKVEPGRLPKVDPERARASLLEADRAFARASREKGTAPAYLDVLAADAQIFRVGVEPAAAVEAVRAAPAGTRLTWEPAGGEVALSGDFGYTYGSAGPDGAEPSERYMRIWRRAPEGPWKLILDIFNPVPPRSPQREKPGA